MRLQLHQFDIRHRREVGASRRFFSFGHDAVDAAAIGEIDSVSADVGVVPVEKVDAAFGARLDAEPNPREIIGRHEVVAVMANKARTLPLHHVGQHGVLVDVAHEQPVAILLGKRVRKIEPGAAVCRQVRVVADCFDVVVDVRIDLCATLLVIRETDEESHSRLRILGRDRQSRIPRGWTNLGQRFRISCESDGSARFRRR